MIFNILFGNLLLKRIMMSNEEKSESLRIGNSEKPSEEDCGYHIESEGFEVMDYPLDMIQVLKKQGQHKCDLQWITPNAETFIMRNARVSSKNPDSNNVGLINYLIKHKHWSPFETASMCVEIVTSRTIARQILRHRTFSFQEFSQRYQDVNILTENSTETDFMKWDARTEHEKNRQSSVETDDPELLNFFDETQREIWDFAFEKYKSALKKGVAKEQARCLLPEGLTKTRMCMSGTIRSWIHYIDLRCAEDTQFEHRIIANLAKKILISECPHIAKALKWCN